MKIIVTTSNKYLHILPIFCYLFNKNWDKNQIVEIVCYDFPEFELPDNFVFRTLGKQEGGAKNFTRDLREYFKKQDDFFIWMMEDTFIKSVDTKKLNTLKLLTYDNVGRINLSKETIKQKHFLNYVTVNDFKIFENTQDSLYRLSTQPSIWNKKFLLKYMQNDLSPWEFETQSSCNDNYRILGMDEAAVSHNEGVRRFDIKKYNFDGIDKQTVDEMKQLNIL